MTHDETQPEAATRRSPQPDGGETKGAAGFKRVSLRMYGGLLIALGALGALVFAACSPPPIGWQGAGRQQGLPEPQMPTDSGTSVVDTGSGPVDAGSDATDAADGSTSMNVGPSALGSVGVRLT